MTPNLLIVIFLFCESFVFVTVIVFWLEINPTTSPLPFAKIKFDCGKVVVIEIALL